MTITVIGTHRNMPAKPQSPPQTASATMMASGLRLSELPMSRGSRMLPTPIWITPSRSTTTKERPKVPNWTRTRSAGKTTPTSEPTTGM